MAVFNRNNVVSARVCSTANFSLKYVYAFPCTRRCRRSVPWFHRVSSPALVLRESPYSGGHASIVSDSQCCSCIHGINALFLPTVYCRHTMRLVVSYLYTETNAYQSFSLFCTAVQFMCIIRSAHQRSIRHEAPSIRQAIMCPSVDQSKLLQFTI